MNKKKLVSGDAVLFLRYVYQILQLAGEHNKDRTNILFLNGRGEDGELRLGIRRAAQLKSCSNFSAPSGQQLNLSSLMDVVNALSARCAFSIHYNPRYFF